MQKVKQRLNLVDDIKKQIDTGLKSTRLQLRKSKTCPESERAQAVNSLNNNFLTLMEDIAEELTKMVKDSKPKVATESPAQADNDDQQKATSSHDAITDNNTEKSTNAEPSKIVQNSSELNCELNQKTKERLLDKSSESSMASTSSDLDSVNSSEFFGRTQRKTKKRRQPRKLSTESPSGPSILAQSVPVIVQQAENVLVKKEPDLNISQDDSPMMMDDYNAAKDIDSKDNDDFYGFDNNDEFEADIKSEIMQAKSEPPPSHCSSENTETYELDDSAKIKHNISDIKVSDIEMDDVNDGIVPIPQKNVDAKALTEPKVVVKSDLINGIEENKVAGNKNEVSKENRTEVVTLAEDAEEENDLISDEEILEQPNGSDADNEEDDTEIQK